MKRIVLFSFLSLVCLSFLFQSCTDQPAFWVNSYTVNCSGVGPRTCLLVQKGKEIVDGEWKNFYANIEGFEYEPGYIYKLEVKEDSIPLAEVPADASSIKYTLVKELEKKIDPKLRLNDIWALETIGTEEIVLTEGLQRPRMELQLNNRTVFGMDGCNNFRGGIKEVGETTLVFSPIVGTRRMCPDMTISDALLKTFDQVRTYEIKDLKLTLFDANGAVLSSFKKVD